MTREEYLQEVIKILNGEGFVENEITDCESEYVKTIIHQQPGQIMVINGQQFQQPGQDVKLEFIIKDLGETWVEDYNGKTYVEQFKFLIKQNGNTAFELDELMYFEKPELILQHFKK